MDTFSRLSLDQLVHILSRVNIKQRLSACSLVSTTWRAAAAQATTDLEVADASRWPPSLWEWLRSHTAAVQFSRLYIEKGAGRSLEVTLQLPLLQMPSLRSLVLLKVPWRPVTGAAASPTAAAAKPLEQSSAPLSSSFRLEGLQPLTALTQLSLQGRSVRLAGLSALTALRELGCECNHRAATEVRKRYIPALTPLEAELITAFPQLQRLTKLKLYRAAASPAVVSHISALQSLQRLALHKASSNSLPALPQSLTYLFFRPKQPCSLTRSNAAGLSQPTALQHLALSSAEPLDMSLLTGIRSLHTLELCSTDVAPGQLQAISRLTGLTALWLLDVSRPPQQQSPFTISAAEAGALTSSSQLVNLWLSSETGGPLFDDCASLFPPGRQLQHLTCLRLSTDFLRDTAAVQQAGSCCPNLRYAKLGKCGRVESVQADDERLIAAGLSAIQVGWSQLRMLRLDDPLPGVIPGRPLWEALGGFSALGYLRIQINSPWADEPEAAHVLCLEGCKELRHLEIDVRAVNAPVVSNGFRSWKLELHSTATSGELPNVAHRLREQLTCTKARRYCP